MHGGVAYLHPRNGPGLPSKHNEPLCDTLRTAVQVSLGADQVVAEAAQESTREHNWHLVRPTHTVSLGIDSISP